ncbi:MAG: M23 family metallopeptidase [Oscillospiraceae bacterium]|nr:M23 family metallopeptidase [Oscillospiraceae bacterium]
MKRALCVLFLLALLSVPAEATIKWVDFDASYEAMNRALDLDIQSQGEDNPQSWIKLLALAAARHGGDMSASDVADAYRSLMTGASPQELMGENYKYYLYYWEAYQAVLGGLVGNYAVKIGGVWKTCYGVKAFSPIAAGYWYAHSDDFGTARNYGFRRKHLGHDMMGSLGTPVIAVESGTVEALGWNQYGGWRIGIRTDDQKRYYYYAHLRKDMPYLDGLREGDRVEAGQVIGFMGRTGYSTKENTNNIETVHLHFGIQLIFEEKQKDCNSEIWIDAYQITRLLERHRSSVIYNETTGTWERIYTFVDLDQEILKND